MKEIAVSFTLVLGTPDEVNEAFRTKDSVSGSGSGAQAASFTDDPANKIFLSWPPIKRGEPGYEYGMDPFVILHALGYEITNLLHLDTDPLGR